MWDFSREKNLTFLHWFSEHNIFELCLPICIDFPNKIIILEFISHGNFVRKINANKVIFFREKPTIFWSMLDPTTRSTPGPGIWIPDGVLSSLPAGPFGVRGPGVGACPALPFTLRSDIPTVPVSLRCRPSDGRTRGDWVLHVLQSTLHRAGCALGHQRLFFTLTVQLLH